MAVVGCYVDDTFSPLISCLPLILLNLTKLSKEQNWLKFYGLVLVSTVFIIIFNSNKKLIWIMMSSDV